MSIVLPFFRRPSDQDAGPFGSAACLHRMSVLLTLSIRA